MTDRGPLFWIAVVAAGIVAVIGIAALLGDDDSDETVAAGEWAQSVCGTVAVWRGELESIVEDIRTPTSAGSGSEEPQSETPQGRTGFIRQGLERAIQATETMVEGVDNAGTPDTEQGEDVAQLVSSWADSAVDVLEDAEDSLDEESDSLEASIGLHGSSRRDRLGAGLRHADRGRHRAGRPRAHGCAARHEYLPGAEGGGEQVDEHHRLDPRRGSGPRRHRLHRARRPHPGEPPISAILIIIAVITAAAAMQAAGGVDYMVKIASSALRARPKLLNFVAPYVSYVLTILTGTGNTFFSIIPVINEVAYANKIRPERALAGSTVASAAGITSSPVAAAMATLLPLVEIFNYDLIDVMLITIPASIVGILAMSIVMSTHGKDLDEDVEFQRRLAAGEIQPPAPPATSSYCPMPSAASRSS